MSARRQAGFTLIEIMVVIAIIGLLATIVAPNVMNRLREAKVTATKAKMSNTVKPAIEDYRRHFSKLPDTLDVLLEPSEKNFGDPYLEGEDQLSDAWENRFQYMRLSSTKYDLISLGADGVEGGENDDADIHSAKSEMP